jgi:hypothetical protein
VSQFSVQCSSEQTSGVKQKELNRDKNESSIFTSGMAVKYIVTSGYKLVSGPHVVMVDVTVTAVNNCSG